jgi:hypothetical protein
VNPHEPDARIAKTKDGSTHLAHKVEHAVDMKTGAVLAVTLQGADQGDTATVQETLLQAGEHVAELLVTPAEKAPEEKPQMYFQGVKEVVTDKGYQSGDVLVEIGRNKGYGSPDLYPREKADTPTRLGWPEESSKSANATRGDLREPAASWRSVREELARYLVDRDQSTSFRGGIGNCFALQGGASVSKIKFRESLLSSIDREDFPDIGKLIPFLGLSHSVCSTWT